MSVTGHNHVSSVKPYMKHTYDSANNALTQRNVSVQSSVTSNIESDIHMNILNIINDLSLVNGETKRMTCPYVILRIHLLLQITWVLSYGIVTRLVVQL